MLDANGVLQFYYELVCTKHQLTNTLGPRGAVLLANDAAQLIQLIDCLIAYLIALLLV